MTPTAPRKIPHTALAMLCAAAITLGAPAQQTASTEESGRVDPPSERLQFDARWLPVRPRTPEGPYPNLPRDWQPIANPRIEVPSNRPLEGLRICIDAGHGGHVWGPTHGYVAGTRGADTGFSESEANLRAALFLWDLLTQAGAEVVMTRTRPDRLTEDDSSARIELHARVAKADDENCDYFLSIHHNAPAPNQPRDVNYTSVYYFDTSQYNDEYNRDPVYVPRHHDEELNRERCDLALAIQEALSRRLDLPPIRVPEQWAEHFGHGVPHGDFHVIRETDLPAVLVECSFMTHPDEDRRLNDPARAKQEALGIFEGILAHFRTHPIRRWSGQADVTP